LSFEEGIGPMTYATRPLTAQICAVAALVLLPFGPAVSQDLVQAGVSAAVQGQVSVARVDAVGRQIDSGEPIFLNDAVTSGPDSGMQIMLLDETVFTIGPESEISIDTFVYDPATGQGSLAANMTKGVMRFVTGNVSSGNPQNMTIKLPVGTIGIRGTLGDVAILTVEEATEIFPQEMEQQNQGVQDPSGNPQPVVFAALGGPGPLTQTGAPIGSFTFSTPNGSVDLNRPGGAVLATPGQEPVFFIAPPGALQQISAGLTARGGNQSSNSDSGNDSSGDQSNSTDTNTESGGTENAQSQSNVSNDTSFKQVNTISTTTTSTSQSQDVANTNDLASNSRGFTYADIAAAFSGESSVSGSGNLTGAITGSFNTNVDFSARTVDIQTGNLTQGSTNIGTVILNSGSGVSVNDLTSSFAIGSNNNTGTCSSCTGGVTFTGTNSLELSVSHNGGTGTGSATLSTGM
jgi:hypothetical protein